MRSWIFAALASTSLVACVKTNAFKCDGDDSLCSGTGARCEADGFCSTPSSTCASGFQYSDTAGDLAGTCVGGDTPMPDGPMPDSPPDSPTGCNPDFAPIANGNANHKYKLISAADGWVTQQTTVCVTANNSYLAVPDNAAELAALFALAGDVEIWVGISDRDTEGTFVEVSNNTTYDQLASGLTIGGNMMNKDCVRSADGTTLDAENCNQSRVAVCECNEQ